MVTNKEEMFMAKNETTFSAETALENIVVTQKMQMILKALKQEGDNQNKLSKQKLSRNRTLN
tara:strand:+ start:1122 stop:1307 length:186 start_codon:yes stop_codon:yes gene_type:complete